MKIKQARTLIAFVLSAVAVMLLFHSSIYCQNEQSAGGDTSSAQAVPLDTTTQSVLLNISAPAPVTEVWAFDTDNDHGHSVSVEWKLSANDGGAKGTVVAYELFRALFPDGPFVRVGIAPSGSTSLVDVGGRDEGTKDYLPDNTSLYYRVDAVTVDSLVRTPSEIAGPVESSGQWFNTGRTVVFAAVFIFTALTLFFVSRAKAGAQLYIRPLAGIEAVDEAIGRATEMGKPILYLLGAGDASEIATIASFTILGRVSKKVAEYQTPIIIPCYDPVVMTVAQEIVRSSYLDAGRPDSYNQDSVFFVTQSQFAYVTAVNGIMMRERPATNIYMGKFYAESLIFAETGALAGSIQIAGTDEIAQIPFFIVACDYALIGEELYAASAYLGREPKLLGTLKAQDYAKAAIIFFIIIGVIFANFGAGKPDSSWNSFREYFKVVD
ncbi:MAG: DUF6754 domain-containing protein [candidate division Zixibacteria bacterium]|nr:DUF6754 domain-containing protein [candidate division Zixibacteria bacterium]